MTSSAQISEILERYTSAARDGGGAALDDAEMSAIRGAGFPPDVPLASWTRADVRRWTILNDLAGVSAADAFAAAALACFENGDAGEQASWCRAVSLLPQPERFLPQVIDACRTNILPLFQAIACDNPYPSAHFPERNFNQVVLKALFNGVPLARIVGLERRRNSELARMAADYAAERTAAGRSVPADIGLAL